MEIAAAIPSCNLHVLGRLLDRVSRAVAFIHLKPSNSVKALIARIPAGDSYATVRQPRMVEKPDCRILSLTVGLGAVVSKYRFLFDKSGAAAQD